MASILLNDFRLSELRNSYTIDGSIIGQSMHGRSTSSCFCTANHVIPFHRINRDRIALKKMGFFLNDSTYSNACDPNSMRDQGRVRNAEYNFAQAAPDCPSALFGRTQSIRTSSGNSINRLRNSINGGPMNRSFYSFGGRTPIKSS